MRLGKGHARGMDGERRGWGEVSGDGRLELTTLQARHQLIGPPPL